ncbi:MAG TPA: hypothetical protein EYP85_08870 [Armatimonadetes bacterium]|nr:hypothetical protein [Armatimonadota bacterium]
MNWPKVNGRKSLGPAVYLTLLLLSGLPGCSARTRSSAEEEVRLETSTEVTAKDLRLPLYPQAVPRSGWARRVVKGHRTLQFLARLDLYTPDPLPQVAAFYREVLSPARGFEAAEQNLPQGAAYMAGSPAEQRWVRLHSAETGTFIVLGRCYDAEPNR